MTINEALDYIHAVDWRRSSLGLSRIDELPAQMGHPERTMKFVHVTGTNGKGSTCAMLASVLRAAGYRTGLYTSPYIFRFNERMQIDGAPISDAELCAVTGEVRPLADGMADHPTEFEMVTAIAFSWFASRKCDIVVCEVGMGGELDATNVIPAPEAAVLCNIGLDHTAYLGDTAEKIAATKSGIIKAGCDAVLYPCAPSVREVVADRCRRCGVTLHPVDMDTLASVSHSLEGQEFSFGSLSGLHLPLLGRMQLRNAAAALTAVEVLRRRGWAIGEDAVRQGLAQVRWPVRFEVVRRKPLVVMDGGHNPQCMGAIRQALEELYPGKKIYFLVGVLEDKDYHSMVGQLLPLAKAFITITPDSQRALQAQALADYLRGEGAEAHSCETVEQGMEKALSMAGPEDVVCVCGSLYMIGEARHVLGLC